MWSARSVSDISCYNRAVENHGKREVLTELRGHLIATTILQKLFSSNIRATPPGREKSSKAYALLNCEVAMRLRKIASMPELVDDGVTDTSPQPVISNHTDKHYLTVHIKGFTTDSDLSPSSSKPTFFV